MLLSCHQSRPISKIVHKIMTEAYNSMHIQMHRHRHQHPHTHTTYHTFEQEIKYTSLDPAFVSAHQSRISAFIEHHDDEVDKERYKRKLRIKSMKRPHLSNDVLHQMYGANRYKEMGASEKTENPPPLRRHLGPVTGFGDGNGSFWDRWLVKEPPPKSSFANGNAYPLRGYKRLHPDRYQVSEKQRHDPNGQVPLCWNVCGSAMQMYVHGENADATDVFLVQSLNLEGRHIYVCMYVCMHV